MLFFSNIDCENLLIKIVVKLLMIDILMFGNFRELSFCIVLKLVFIIGISLFIEF